MSEMARAKGRKQSKIQVREYTKKSGTEVRAHERQANLRFEPVYRNPYFSEGCIHADDPLVDELESSLVVIDHDQAVGNCEHMNDLYAKEDKTELIQWLVDNFQMKRKEATEAANWTPITVNVYCKKYLNQEADRLLRLLKDGIKEHGESLTGEYNVRLNRNGAVITVGNA
jgi:hypothetical protein